MVVGVNTNNGEIETNFDSY